MFYRISSLAPLPAILKMPYFLIIWLVAINFTLIWQILSIQIALLALVLFKAI